MQVYFFNFLICVTFQLTSFYINYQIIFQPLHGSPKNVIFPAHNYPAQAFQNDSGQSIINSSPSTKAASQYSHTVVSSFQVI